MTEVTKYVPSLDVVRKLENAAETLQERITVRLLGYCGLCTTELLDLRVDDIDIDGTKTLWVEGRGHFDGEWIPCDSTTLKLLDEYTKGMADRDSLFKCSRIAISRIIASLAAKAHIEERVTPHSLRHFFATRLVGNTKDTWIPAYLLGRRPASLTVTEHLEEVDRVYRRTFERGIITRILAWLRRMESGDVPMVNASSKRVEALGTFGALVIVCGIAIQMLSIDFAFKTLNTKTANIGVILGTVIGIVGFLFFTVRLCWQPRVNKKGVGEA
ncbi:site-specific integrase [Candidatus Bathyarchaeota archaeon]|nr:site-specific integrase [Candidatus Bathyarchaeota archaeon]